VSSNQHPHIYALRKGCNLKLHDSNTTFEIGRKCSAVNWNRKER